MQELLASKAAGVLAAFTKADTLPRSRRLAHEQELAHALALDHDQLVVTSAHAGQGIAELRDAMDALIRAVA